MSCCDDFGNCAQGRDCPVRSAQAAPAKVAIARPLYRRCDIDGVCKQPDAQCRERCLLSSDEDGEVLTQLEQVVAWLVTTLAAGLVLVLLGGVVGYLYEVFR
jgi:hypothetical protein